MTLKLFTKDNMDELIPYRKSLIEAMTAYFKEVHKDDFKGNAYTISNMVLQMLKDNKSIYLLTKENEVLGFIVVYINDQYGNTTPVIVNDYMYLQPQYRSGRAVGKLYAMIGIICDSMGYDCVSSTYTTSANDHNNQLVDGDVIAKVTHFSLESIRKNLKRYRRLL